MTTDTKNVDLYKESGVDVQKGDALVDWLKVDKGTKDTRYGEVVSGIGGFAALFRPNFSGMKDPLLISGTDGVGTKVLLGLDWKKLTGLGEDLVAMCVNDLYTIGGRPLFFLDYYATGVLDDHQFKDVLSGIKAGLTKSETLLMGGETAELPGLYAKGHFDLAGFVVGMVDGPKRLGPHLVKGGDVLVSFTSDGFHSNGYSLVRKWLDSGRIEITETLKNQIMKPTRIYGEIPQLLEKLGDGAIHSLAHITGGGISGNLPRVMPNNMICELKQDSIPTPVWMKDFINAHDASFEQVEKVFNMGAGMIAAVNPDRLQDTIDIGSAIGLELKEIGVVKEGKEEKTRVEYI